MLFAPSQHDTRPFSAVTSQIRFSSLLSNVVGPQTGLEKYEKAKKDAEVAEGKYKREVVILDRLR